MHDKAPGMDGFPPGAGSIRSELRKDSGPKKLGQLYSLIVLPSCVFMSAA